MAATTLTANRSAAKYAALVFRLAFFYAFRALVDWPGSIRRVENFKRLALTDMKVEIPRLAKKSVLIAKLNEAGAC